MTTPNPETRTPDPRNWTPDEWIDEAVAQYAATEPLMRRWSNDTRPNGVGLVLYQHAAHAAHRAAAAAAIAAAKMAWDMTDS